VEEIRTPYLVDEGRRPVEQWKLQVTGKPTLCLKSTCQVRRRTPCETGLDLGGFGEKMFEQFGATDGLRERKERVIVAADFGFGKGKKEKSFLGRRFCACMI